MATQANDQREGVLKEALAILDRNGDKDSQLRGNVLGEFSQWAFAPGHPQGDGLRPAEREAAPTLSPSDDLVEALIMEGVTRRQTGEPERAEALLTEAERMAKAVGGELSTQLTRIYAYRSEARYSLGNWSGAQQDLEEGFRIGQRLGGPEMIRPFGTWQHAPWPCCCSRPVKNALVPHRTPRATWC